MEIAANELLLIIAKQVVEIHLLTRERDALRASLEQARRPPQDGSRE